jgi:hypothetical protein
VVLEYIDCAHLELLADALLCPSHFLTLGLREGSSDVDIEPAVSTSTKGKQLSRVAIRNGSSLICEEIPLGSASPVKGEPSLVKSNTGASSNRSSDWLALLLREHLGMFTSLKMVFWCVQNFNDVYS